MLCLCIIVILTGCQELNIPKIHINLPGKQTSTSVIPTPEPKKGTVEPPQKTPLPELSTIPIPKAEEPIFYPELLTISVSSETKIVSSPSQSHVSLPVKSIKPGDTAQLVASDPDGAWLLLLYQNTLGWIPTIYLGFGSGTLNVSVLYIEPEEACNGYLGSVTSLSKTWESNVSGNIKVQAVSYLPSGSTEDGRWTAVVQETNREVELQVATTNLAQGGQVNLFTVSVDNISEGEHIAFLNTVYSAVPFQASFFTTDCSQVAASGLQGDASDPGMGSTPAPTIRVITIQVISSSGRATAFPYGTPGVQTTPWEACKGTYLSRLQVGDLAYVSYTPPRQNNIRKMPYVTEDKVGELDPGEKVEIIKGPSCSDGYIWWKVTSEKDGLTGWTAEGDIDNYWLIPISTSGNSAEQFIWDYFSYINNKKYEMAWSMLSTNFKETYNSSGFGPYKDWWESVKEVGIISIKTKSQSSNEAVVDVELSFYMRNGKVDTYDLIEYGLVFDYDGNHWLFNNSKLLKGSR